MGLSCFGTIWVSWTLVAISFPILGKFSTIISSHIFSCPFLLSSSARTPMIQMLGHLTLSQRSLRLSSFVLILSSFFPLCSIYFHHSFTSLILSSASAVLLLFPSRVLLIWVITLFIIGQLFFTSSRSLLNTSCIFSVLVSRLFICNSIWFSRFWIIFTIIILNYFSGGLLSSLLLIGLAGIYHVPLPAEYFSAFAFCLDCCIWGDLSVGWKSAVPVG